MLNIKNIKKVSIILLVLVVGVTIGRAIPEQASIAEVEKAKEVQGVDYYRDYTIGYINELKYDKKAERYYLIMLINGQNDPEGMEIYIPSSMPYHEENSKMLEEYYIDKEVLLTFEHEGGELIEWQVLQP